MKKIAFLFVIGLFMTATAVAQKPIKENITIGEQILPGFSLTISDLDAGTVGAALADYLAKQGLVKPGKVSGFTYYNNQHIPKIGTANYDIYTKVAQEGKKKNSQAKVYFVVTKGNMNPITETADREAINMIMAFLEEFTPYAHSYSVGKNIEALEKDLAKQKKELEKQQSKVEKMNKDIEKQKKQIDDTQSKLNSAKTLLQQYK